MAELGMLVGLSVQERWMATLRLHEGDRRRLKCLRFMRPAES